MGVGARSAPRKGPGMKQQMAFGFVSRESATRTLTIELDAPARVVEQPAPAAVPVQPYSGASGAALLDVVLATTELAMFKRARRDAQAASAEAPSERPQYGPPRPKNIRRVLCGICGEDACYASHWITSD